MNKYEQIDTLILEKIRDGRNQFPDILVGSGQPYRTIDRRLQSLRKRGLIHYVKGHWHITGAAP